MGANNKKQSANNEYIRLCFFYLNPNNSSFVAGCGYSSVKRY